LLTPAARQHLRLLARDLQPLAGRLDRRFRRQLREHPYDAAQCRALLAITPAAAARLHTLDGFFEQAEYNGRRLAKLNLPPGEVNQRLGEFGAEVNALLQGR